MTDREPPTYHYAPGHYGSVPQPARPAPVPARVPAAATPAPADEVDVGDLRKLIIVGLFLNVFTLVLALAAAFTSGYVWYTLVQLQKALQEAGF